MPGLKAQSNAQNVLSTEEIDRYKLQIQDLVQYFEGTLNFIGDPQSVIKEKEIIINESYLKIFKDDKVQVEDDLDEGREVTIHKDVQAYLKDIEFFFRSVKFSFIISDITFNINEENLTYFKVTLNRDLQGITVNGDSVANRKIRFMEINLDIASSDLRIASLYTTRLNEKEEIRNWWNGLSDAWRLYFGENAIIYDSLNLSELYFIADSLILISPQFPDNDQDSARALSYEVELPPQRQVSLSSRHFDSVYVNTSELFNKLMGILKRKDVDVSGNENIRSLEPLSEFSGLTGLNCSNTLVISLFPVRNLNHLEFLDVSDTPVDDLAPLQYSTSLKELNCSFTLLDDLSPISGLYKLEKLECAGLRIYNPDFAKELVNLRELNLSETKIHDLSAIAGLTKLEELDVSETGIRNFEAMSVFTGLRYLNAESTSISRLDPLKNLELLEVLKISYTGIETLQPLNELPNLKRIYWDSNGAFRVDKENKKEEAITYMNNHPGSLVIFESEELLNSWAGLEEPWRQMAGNAVGLSENPTKEELHALLQLEEIRIDSTPITTLNPVARLYSLKRLSIPGLHVIDFSPIGEAIELEYLDLSNSSVKSLDFAVSLKNLKELNVEGTSIYDLSPLDHLKELKYVYADNSRINDAKALYFRDNNPVCMLIYKTDELMAWWKSLPDAWKSFFTSAFALDSPPAKEQLHRLFYLEKLEIESNVEIRSFEPIKQLIHLKIIKLSELTMGDLQYITYFEDLQELHCTQMPVTDLSFVSTLGKLEVLNLENTPVSDLNPIYALNEMRRLNVSGTQVKSLKPVAGLSKLKTIELNNTQVKNIRPLFSLASIQSVSCFNTRISSKSIEKFKEQKPDCKVVYY